MSFKVCSATNHVPTKSMEQSPSWEANRSSFILEISHILWNAKVHYRIHTTQPPVLFLSQINQVHASLSHLLKIHFNIILPTAHRSSRWTLFFSRLQQNPVSSYPLSHTCHMPRPSHSSWFDHQNSRWWGVHSIKLLVISTQHKAPCH